MKENKILKENNLEDLIKKFSKSDIVSSIRENYSKENIKYISNYLISDNKYLEKAKVFDSNLKNIKSNGATALLIAVYGNRAIDDCLLELKNILTEQGFKCRAAISAVAEHSMMPKFAANRPDSKDIVKNVLLVCVVYQNVHKMQNLYLMY